MTGNFINGSFEESRNDFASLNPCNENPLNYFPQSRKEEVSRAVLAAREALPAWKAKSKVQRAECFDNLCQILKKRTDEITNWISNETGKNLNESRAEVIEALHMAQYCFGKGRDQIGEVVASELPERDSYIIRKPKGVVAVIAPWNFPFAIGGFWCAGPALMEGNTVVFKPSELTPTVGSLTAELFHEAGFPAGVFNMIHGDGEVGDMLVKSDVDHIAFTGSAEVGKMIRQHCAETWTKSCSCEMGSKSAVIVFDDCDLDLAVSACVNSAFKLSGQRCVSAGRLIVHRKIFGDFRTKFLEQVARVYVGDPFEKQPECSVSFGPLISSEQRDRVEMFNRMVREDKDANVLMDSHRNPKPVRGYFLTPFVYECEWADKPFLKQEVFGPHVSLIPFDNLDHAINIYNDTEYGLALGAVTENFRTMREIRNCCDAGMIYFNLGSIGAESHLPFTGVKKSGHGGSSAAGMFDSVVNKVAVTINHAPRVSFPQGLK